MNDFVQGEPLSEENLDRTLELVSNLTANPCKIRGSEDKNTDKIRLKGDKYMEHENIKVGQIMYWARVLPKIDIYDLYELKVRTVYDTYFVAVDKRSKQSYIFKYKDINKTIYIERTDALDYIKTEESKR